MLKIMVRHKLALAAVWALSMTGTSASGDIIHACVLRTTGALRIIDTNKSCAPNERAIKWDQIGLVGPAGPERCDRRSEVRDSRRGSNRAMCTSVIFARTCEHDSRCARRRSPTCCRRGKAVCLVAPLPYNDARLLELPRRDQKTADISISVGAHGAIFSFAPSLPPDVPRTPGRRQMASQPAVSTGHPAAGMPGLSRGHTRTASRLLDRASYA
jgi:hypothetical protein